MVQVLPYLQTPLEQLLPHINQLAGGIGMGLANWQTNKKIAANNEILKDPKATAIQKFDAFSQMPETYKKSTGPAFAALLGPQAEYEAYNQYTNNQQNPQGETGQSAVQQPMEFEGYKFSPEEQSLLTPNKPKPAIGPLKDEAKIEAKDRQRAEDKTNKFMEKFPDIEKSESDLRKLYEASKIIEDLPDDLMRKVIQAKLEDKSMDSISEIFKTAGQQKLFYLMRPYLQTKEIGGSNPSTKEVLLALASLPSGLKTKEANKYIIGQMILDKENQNKLIKFYNYATSKNPHISPSDLQRIGNKITAPPVIEKVPPGTKLTHEIEDQLILQYGDVNRAEQAARDAGYEFPK